MPSAAHASVPPSLPCAVELEKPMMMMMMMMMVMVMMKRMRMMVMMLTAMMIW